MEKTFLRNNIIRYEFYSKFATFTDFDFEQKNLKVFFQIKTIFFFMENPNFVRNWEILLFQYNILWQICYDLVIKIFQSQNLGIAQTIGK